MSTRRSVRVATIDRKVDVDSIIDDRSGVESRMETEAVRDAIDSLDTPKARVVTLIVIQGMSETEVAKKLGLPSADKVLELEMQALGELRMRLGPVVH
jgi:DNA-directed RNA polymerase specialized sigma24 family protein